jgi:hypothetical protein
MGVYIFELTGFLKKRGILNVWLSTMNDNITLRVSLWSIDYISFKDGKRKKGFKAPLSSEGRLSFSFICTKIRA